MHWGPGEGGGVQVEGGGFDIWLIMASWEFACRQFLS